MIKYHIYLAKTITGVILSIVPISAIGFLIPRRMVVFDRSNLYQDVEEYLSGGNKKGAL